MAQHLLDCAQVGPPESRWVAKEWRRRWGFTLFLIPASLACFLTIDQSDTLDRPVPRLPRKSSLRVRALT